MKKQELLTNGTEPRTKIDNVYWVEDVNGNALGSVEFEDTPGCGDLVFLDYGSERKCYVIYSEQENLCDEFLIFEQISKDEFEKFSNARAGVVTHFALGDENFNYSNKNTY